MSWILLGYGIAIAIGDLWGGKLADRKGGGSGTHFHFRVTTFGYVPELQAYVMQKAEQYAPEAIDVASGLNIAAFNIGIAVGSIIGGQTVQRIGLDQTPCIGAVIVALALIQIILSGKLDKQFH